MVNVHSSKMDIKHKRKQIDLDDFIKTEEKTMTKQIKIEGMMCPHCEATVKKALEAVEGVESAVASHTDATATVTLSKDVADAVLIKAVVDAGYTVVK